MATLFSYPDSRALLSVAIGARKIGINPMNNLSRAIALMDSNPRLKETVAILNQKPPATLRDIVDAIAARRNVTLYRKAS